MASTSSYFGIVIIYNQNIYWYPINMKNETGIGKPGIPSKSTPHLEDLLLHKCINSRTIGKHGQKRNHNQT